MGDIVNAVADVFGFGPASKQSKATTEAANISAQGSREALALQQRMYEEGVARQQPWLKAGEDALNKLIPMADYTMFGPEQFSKDPGYGFRLAEGQKGLDRQAAARGGLISGGALKEATRFGQEMGSQEYSNAFNRYQIERNARLGPLQSLAGVGQTSVNQLGQAGQNYANQANQVSMTNAANQGNLALQRGNIAATQYGNYANVLGNALSKYNFSGSGGNTYTGAGQTNPITGEYMGSVEF
jgi:hypothetical protein